MALTQKDRGDFLMRLGVVRKVRANGEEVSGEYVDEDGHEWTDQGIEMAIAFGF
ncbi:MAG: hypothetical protein Q8L08_03560 [Candidatus Nanopelagicaceae bacterium]|nr:hypothetical protein [Candidatus Nanopelagicaceae bacterium]